MDEATTGVAGSAGEAVLAHLGGQRACRVFSGEPVSDSDLTRILEAATHAPSAENAQPWIFVVVQSARIRAELDALTRRIWEAGGRHHAERTLTPRLFASVDAFMSGGYGGAPVLVVAAGDGRSGAGAAVLAASVLPACQNLLLAAGALGYGSSMTTLAAQAPDEMAALLELPAQVRPFAVIPIGRAARPLGPPRRRPVSAVAHRDRFGEPWPGSAPR